MTEKELHESLRSQKIEAMNKTINTLPEGQFKDCFKEVASAIETVAIGVNEAHARIDIRKNDTDRLVKRIDKLSEIVAYTSADSIERNERVEENSRVTRHNSKVTKLVTYFSVAMSLFLVFGGAGMLKQMGIVSSAVKTLELILR